MTTVQEYEAHFDLPKPSPDPDWIPVLEAEDMCTGPLHSGPCHCAFGWREVLGLDWGRFCQAYAQANGCKKAQVGLYNDFVCTTDQQRADAFNRAALLYGEGYEVKS